MVGVAVVAHEVIDGMSWEAAFVLGAVVSPTDPVAATAIAARVGAPRRFVTIVEGEALVNDATALVAYKFARRRGASPAASRWPRRAGASCSTRSPAWRSGSRSAALVARLRKRARRRADRDHDLAGHAVLRLPAGRGARRLGRARRGDGRHLPGLALAASSSRPTTRIQAFAVWEILVFVLNAALFVLVGLQLPSVLDGISGRRRGAIVGSTPSPSRAAVIVVRFLWVFPATYLPRLLSRRVREREPPPHVAVRRHRRLDGHARRGLAGRGARHPADDRRAAAPSRSATSSSSSPTR